MKSAINISLDTEIIEQLRQEDNYSDLINQQLKAYYEADKCDNLKILLKKQAEMKQERKLFNKKRRLIDKKIEKILTKEKKIIQKVKINRVKLITKIKIDRKNRQRSGRFIRYYVSPEEEADRIIMEAKK